MVEANAPACRTVADEMAVLVEQWQASADPRAIFIECYLRMTRNMLDAIDGAEFQDAAWVDQLLVRFAGHYFAALTAYERASLATPAVWRIAHDAAGQPQTMTLQNLFLGVNAHINYDLVLTVVELLTPEWTHLSAEERRLRYADYTHVNDVIARTIDVVQDEIVERATPALELVDRLLGRLDEWAIARLVGEWREDVWRHAVAMLETPDQDDCERLRQTVEAATVTRAEWILGSIATSGSESGADG